MYTIVESKPTKSRGGARGKERMTDGFRYNLLLGWAGGRVAVAVQRVRNGMTTAAQPDHNTRAGE